MTAWKIATAYRAEVNFENKVHFDDPDGGKICQAVFEGLYELNDELVNKEVNNRREHSFQIKILTVSSRGVDAGDVAVELFSPRGNDHKPYNMFLRISP